MFSNIKKLVVIVILLLAPSIYAIELFEDNTILELQLSGPLSNLIHNKKKKISLPFVLTVNGSGQEVLLRTRGHSRIGVCKFPPLRLQFIQPQPDHSIFYGYEKLKLVTHCRNTPSAQAYPVQELLAYKIFNQFTDVSYRVRQTRITYVNTNAHANSKPLVRYAFIIEPRLAMIRRLGGRPVEAKGVSLKSLNKEHMSHVYVFQYLIGNTDWSLVKADSDDFCCHNGTLIDIDEQRYYVPFDFDLSGLVNARYAFPDASLRIKKVTQRLYRGFCLSPEILLATIDEINKKESGIKNIANELPGLSEKKLKTINKFLDGFFNKSNNSIKLSKLFERKCL